MPITLDAGAADRGPHRTEEPIFAQSLAVPVSEFMSGIAIYTVIPVPPFPFAILGGSLILMPGIPPVSADPDIAGLGQAGVQVAR